MHDCSVCPQAQKATRKCDQEGFENTKGRGWRVDSRSLTYKFCPGKATWYPEIFDTFEECRLAYYTGILPGEGNFFDQHELFVECYPSFIEHWRERHYGRIWRDVEEFTEKVLEAVGKMFGGKKGRK